MKHLIPMLAVNLCVGIVPALGQEIPGSWVPVSDKVLAHVTGKYLDQNMISGFQLEMISHWQTPTGAQLYAAGALNVHSGSDGLQVSTSAHSGIIPGHHHVSTAGLYVPTGGDQLQINGVGQITQVAGNGNAATNQTVIDFVPSTQNTSSGGSSNTSSSSNTSVGGMSASATIGANGLNVALQAPFGNVAQSIAAGAGSPVNRIMQVIQVGGNQQQVLNNLLLQVQTAPMSANLLRQIGTQQALSGMLGIRR